MSIDAQAWVWNESRTKGNARLVMLAVADKAPGPECTARMGLTEFIKRVNAARSTTIEAIDKALGSGELVILEEARGSRAALYQLPKAIGYERPTAARRGPETGPVADSQGSENRTPNAEQGSGNRTGTENARGPESGPGGSENRTPSGPESGPHYQTTSTKSDRAIDTDAFPVFARPLSDQLGLAGVTVRWPFNQAEWFKLHAAINKSGIPALVDYARRSYARQNGNVDSARFFLPGWCELPPMPSADAERPPLRAIAGGQTNWQPYTNPTDHSAYQNGWT